MNDTDEITVSETLLDPAGAFRSPADVVAHEGLSRQDKLAILKAWRDQEEAERNMPESAGGGGGHPGRLHDVLDAITELSL